MEDLLLDSPNPLPSIVSFFCEIFAVGPPGIPSVALLPTSVLDMVSCTFLGIGACPARFAWGGGGEGEGCPFFFTIPFFHFFLFFFSFGTYYAGPFNTNDGVYEYPNSILPFCLNLARVPQ